MVDALLQDIRSAARSLGRSPGFTLVVVLTLALSIGANAALFSALNAMLFRRLPVHDPDQLIAISVVDDKDQGHPLIYLGTFDAFRARQQSLAAMALYSGGGLLPTVARGTLVDGLVEAATPELYPLLGVRAAVGRMISAVDAPPTGEAAQVVVLGYRFWQRQFGGDPNALGETLAVDGLPLTIIGVTPPDFHGLQVDGGADIWVPMSVLRRAAGDPRLPLRGWNIIGRLRSGVSVEQARAEVTALWPSLQAATLPAGLNAVQQDQMRSLHATVEALATGFSPLRRRYAGPLGVLVGLAGVLLAVGCANLGGLLLARAASRDHQVAVRIAVGASRARLIQHVVVESLMLSAAGTACALPFAWWASRLLGVLVRGGSATPLAMSMTPDARVLSLSALVAVVTGLLVSVLPAWLATAPRADMTLRPARAATSTVTASGRTLLVLQIALSMILIVCAGLFARSLARLRANDSAFPARRIVFGRMWLKPGVRTATINASYLQDVTRRLSAIKGVEALGFSMGFPGFFNFRLRPETFAPSDAQDHSRDIDGIAETISPAFFETVGMARIRGRDFTWTDDERGPAVAIVNASMSRRLFGDADAIGRTIRIGLGAARRAVEIVGVVEDAPMGNLREPHAPAVFRPILQEPQRSLVPIVIIRTRADVVATGRAVRDIVPGAGPHYMRTVTPLEEHVSQSLLQERLLAGLAIAFAALALLVACIGVYSLLAYAVARRTREIGVRMALGASRTSVLRLIVGEGAALALIGVLIGIPGALATGRVARSLLYDLAPHDPLTMTGAGLLFLAVATAAGWLPAARASAIDPIAALRQE